MGLLRYGLHTIFVYTIHLTMTIIAAMTKFWLLQTSLYIFHKIIFTERGSLIAMVPYGLGVHACLIDHVHTLSGKYI